MFKQFFNRQWWWTTLLVLAAMGVMARLGVWQLERLEARREFNARVKAQIAQPPLALTGDALKLDPTLDSGQALNRMEYRAVNVTGHYDHSQEVAIRNQVWNNRYGVHLLTPLVIEGSELAVLVDRGWIPYEDWKAGNAGKYAEPGKVEVHGVIRAARSRPDFGGVPDPIPAPGEKLRLWNNVNVSQIGKQVSYPLLPVYIQQTPATPAVVLKDEPGAILSPSLNPAFQLALGVSAADGEEAGMTLPVRSEPELDLSEGSHMGYALQWFTFATILGIGYLFYIRQSTQPRAAVQSV